MKRDTNPIWWLHPAPIFMIAAVGISIAALAIPEELYRSFWRTPKFFDVQTLAVAFACAATFGFGATAGSWALQQRERWRLAPPPPADPPEWLLTLLLRISFWLCVLGYVIWGGLAVSRGMTLDTVVGILTGEKGAMYYARFDYLPTVGGVTTLTQFGTAAVVFAGVIGCKFGWRRVAPKLIVILGLALVRVVINSERFALLELVLPLMVVVLGFKYVGARRIPWPVRWTAAAAPAFGALGLFVVFTAFEYFRSWSNYYAGGQYGLFEFGALRLMGYYVTAFNNGAYLLEAMPPYHAPFCTLHALWRFPLTAPFFARLFPDPIFDSGEEWLHFPYLEFGANLEFNNGGGIFLPLMDFEVPGGLIYWLMAGVVCGVLYRLYVRQAHAGVLLYPVVFLGVLESPLALYWGEGRAFPSICMLVLAATLISLAQRRERFRENIARAGREIEGASWAQSH